MNFKKMFLIFIFLILFLPFNVEAAVPVQAVNQAYGVFYNDYYVNELPIHEDYGGRAFCLDHNKEYGYLSGYSHTIWEGPACAFTIYSKDSKSGTYGLHYIIQYIQYYANSDFSCNKYIYSSGICDENNKNAAEDETAKLKLYNPSSFELSNNYYISNVKIEKGGPIENYKATLKNAPVGTIITTSIDSNVDIMGTSVNNSEIYVKIPATKLTENNNLNLSITGDYSTTCKYKVPGLRVYNPKYSSDQRVGFPTSYSSSKTNTFTIEDSLMLNATPIIGSIKITKLDKDTNLPLEGVKFKLYTQNNEEAKYVDGTLVGELTTDVNGQILVENLVYDTYLLREISSLPEYIGQSEDALVILNKDYIEMTITNDPIVLKISKLDLTSNEEVEGAEIAIKDEQGNIVEIWTSTTEPKQFYIAPGTYTLTENLQPNGYQKVETIFKFRVNADGTIELLDSDSKYLKLSGNELILYNEVQVVEVPDTLSTMNYILIAIGVIGIVGGAILIYKGTNLNLNKKLDK